MSSDDQTRWRGEGWQVSIDGERTGSGAVRVEQAQASPAREARALAAAVTAAATRLDGGPPPSGSVADTVVADVEGMSHGLLVAVLMALGGSIELEGADVASDAMGDVQGRLYGVELQPLSSSRFRLAVVNSHPATAPGQ